MGVFSSPPPPAEASSVQKITNFFVQNGRGVIGSIPIIVLPIILLIKQDDLKTRPVKCVLFLYIMMFSALFIHPMKVPTIAFVPVFALPLLHVMNSLDVTKCYFSATSCLMVVGGFVHQMINASGWDKRIVMWMLQSDKEGLSDNKLLINSSIAAYFLSMISSRMHVTGYIMDAVVGNFRAIGEPKTKAGQPKPKPKPNKDPFCAVLANAISTSSTLGSLAIVHGARNMLFMRIIWDMAGRPDTFNFLDYSLFAFPLSLLMFAANLAYNIVMLKFASSTLSGAAIVVPLAAARDKIPKKVKAHEYLTVSFTVLALIMYFTRWSNVMWKITKSTRGWADQKMWLGPTGETFVGDATTASIICVICCSLPSTFNFIKVFMAKKESDLPPHQADSAIIFWKFVDKNTNYGYMFLAGGFVALNKAMTKTMFGPQYLYNSLKFTYDTHVAVITLIWTIIPALLCNIMTCVAVTGMLIVLVMNAIPPHPMLLKEYQFVLAISMASSFGFMAHFKYTPQYTVKTIAGITKPNQIKVAFGSVAICTLISWLGVYLYAPVIFE